MKQLWLQMERRYILQDNNPRVFFIQSPSLDPWFNLALEEYLFSQIREGEIILYLWQNDKTVVVGKNQNAWKECDWESLEQDEGKLARRLSGGGAVYHDRGNLNFTFIAACEIYHEHRQIEVILDAVRSCGIEAEFSGRNDLCVEGRKFSGNAFYMNERAAFHHGTLLVNTNMERMARYLLVSPAKIRSKGVDSVQSRVINLKDLRPDLSIADLSRALQNSFRRFYGDYRELSLEQIPGELMEDLYKKYSSWDWRFGASPHFDIELEQTYDWGTVNIGLSLQDGRIKSAVLYSDAMDSILIESIAGVLTGLIYENKALMTALSRLIIDPESERIIKDILSCLSSTRA